MENPKQSNNVVKIGHNSNRSITQETVEKISNRLLHITDVVMNNIRVIEQKYFEASTKYPYSAKGRGWERHKKLLPHHVEDARREGDEMIQEMVNNLADEQDNLQSALKEKYGIEVESARQKWNRECAEEDRRIADEQKK
jgi:hypothetical protein